MSREPADASAIAIYQPVGADSPACASLATGDGATSWPWPAPAVAAAVAAAGATGAGDCKPDDRMPRWARRKAHIGRTGLAAAVVVVAAVAERQQRRLLPPVAVAVVGRLRLPQRRPVAGRPLAGPRLVAGRLRRPAGAAGAAPRRPSARGRPGRRLVPSNIPS